MATDLREIEERLSALEGRFPKNALRSTMEGHVHATSGGVSDHGALAGLGDDDHSIYAHLAGRSGGQTLIGGTATGEFLTLEGNSVDASSITQVRQDSVTASVNMFREMIGAEANPRWAFGFDSSSLVRLSFGPGGASALDMHFERASATTIRLRRSAVAAAPIFQGLGSTDTQARWQLGTVGLAYGPGGATAVDTTFNRVAAGMWAINSRMRFPAITTPTDPIPSDVMVYARNVAGNTRWFYQDNVNREVGPLGTLPGTFGNFAYPLGGFNVSDTAALSALAATNAWGTLADPTVNASTQTVVVDRLPYIELNTGATINSDASFEWPLHWAIAPGAFVYLFRISAAATIRMFIGYTDQTRATMMASDNPAGSYVGLQYSSARGDINFQYVAKDGVTQTLVDSGIAADATPYIFKMSNEATSGTFFSIFSDAWVQTGTTGSIAVGLPAGIARVVAGARCLAGAAARTFRTQFIYESATV